MPPIRILPAAVLVLAAACSPGPEQDADEQTSAPAPAPIATAGFVGSAVCAGCHEAETSQWRGSHHDLAMQPADPATVLGDFDGAEFEYAGTTSVFDRRGDAFVVTTDGPDGELVTYEVAYAFGFDPLQQYLIEFPDGRLQALGIVWDTRAAEAGGQRWFHLYPNDKITHDDPLHWTGRLQNWNYMCADCHVTGFRRNYDAGSDRFASTFTDIDVGCEACHGPASAHVERAEVGQLGDDSGLVVSLSLAGRQWLREGQASIAGLNAGSAPLGQVEVCARCHARRAPISESFVHGRALMDTYLPATLRDPLYFPDGQILDEVYVYGSFLQSKMHAAGVVCTDCHEPHSLETRAEGDALCERCHAPAVYSVADHHRHPDDAPAPACVDCHMSERYYMVVDGRRDHSFRVPRPDLARDLGVPDACDTCHGDRPDGWSASAVRSWLGRDAVGMQQFGHALHAAAAGSADARSGLIGLIDDQAQPAIVRATALEYLIGYPGPESLDRALAALDDAQPMVRRAALRGLDGVPPRNKRSALLRRLDDPVKGVRTEAARQLAGTDPGSLTEGHRQQLQAALSEYVESQKAFMDRPESWLNLSAVYAQAGQAAAAETYLRTAIERDPDFEPAYVNLADLYRARGLEGQSAEVLREGLEAVPDGPALNYATGLQIVRSDTAQAAIPWLRRAVELAPENTRYRYVLAVAEFETGQHQAAVEGLEEAHRLRPADIEVVAALANYYRVLGQPEMALAYARKWLALNPDDPGASGLIEALSAG